MTLNEAVQLIEKAAINPREAGTWADLGCGSGVFTRALASLLPAGSLIYAVDQKRHAFNPPAGSEVTIEMVQADFEKEQLNLPQLDGILMANALHYVADKPAFLEDIQSQLKTNGAMIIVEYDTTRANPWVPYPITFIALIELLRASGFGNIHKIGERPSVYQGQMYACFASRKGNSERVSG